MFIQNTDRFCFVSSEYISKFYTEFAVQLQKRYEQYDSCMELAHEIKAYVGNAFEEKSFPSIENIFGLRLNSVLNKEFKFDCIEPDYSLFFAMDCIAQWILVSSFGAFFSGFLVLFIKFFCCSNAFRLLGPVTTIRRKLSL